METMPFIGEQHNGKPFSFDQKQVNTLVMLMHYKGSNIKLKFILKDNFEIEGFIEDFEGYNCVSVSPDIWFPVNFKIKTSVEIITLDSMKISIVIPHSCPSTGTYLL